MKKLDFAQPLFYLNVIGMHPLKNGRFSQIRQFFTLVLYAVVIFSGVLELISNPGLTTYARATDTMVPQCQLLTKLAVLILQKKRLGELLDKSQKFWPLQKFGSKFQSFGTTHVFLRQFFKFYQIAIIFTCCQFTAAKLIFKSKLPVCISYGESEGLKTPYDELYLILHSLTTFLTINVINGFDGLFFYFIGHILSELRMIKVAFGNNQIEKSWDEKQRFRNSVEHHSHVLEFVQTSSQIFSVVLLVQQLSSLFAICFGLFLMSKDGLPPRFELALKYVPYILSFIIQTWTFCFAGQLLIDWSSEIPDQIFYSSWKNDFDYKNGTARVLTIKRAQRPAKLTIGAFRNLDLESFKLVMNKAFSFFTFINTMIEKRNLEKR